MKTKVIKLLGGIFMMIITQLNAQDYHFSQYFNTPLVINPALTGLFNGHQRAILYYRNQWGGVIDNPYKTFGFSGDALLLTNTKRTGSLSGGLAILNDRAGTINMGQTQVLLSCAYHQKIGFTSILTGGIQGGFSQRTLDKDKMLWDNQYVKEEGKFDPTRDSKEKTIHESFGQADLGVGVAYTFITEQTTMISNDGIKFTLAASVYHLHSPKQTFGIIEDKLYTKAILYANGLIGIRRTNFAIAPSFLYETQGPNQEILLGGNLRYMLQEASRYTGRLKESALLLGCHYRLKDAIIPYLCLEFANWALGISYDSTISGLSQGKAAVGGFEVNLRYINPNPFTPKSKSFY